MDLIDVEPFKSVLQATLVPYDTFEDETTTAEAFRGKKNYPLENQNAKSLNLEDNPVQTMIEMVGKNTESKVNLFGSRENSPIEKQGN